MGYKLPILIIILLISCLGLNVWAIQQIKMDTSEDSIMDAISKIDFQEGSESVELDTELTLSNPTPIPIIGIITYDFSYKNTEIGNGKTDLFFIGPSSKATTPISFKLTYDGGIKTLLEMLADYLKGEKEHFKLILYIDFGPFKFPVSERRVF